MDVKQVINVTQKVVGKAFPEGEVAGTLPDEQRLQGSEEHEPPAVTRVDIDVSDSKSSLVDVREGYEKTASTIIAQKPVTNTQFRKRQRPKDITDDSGGKKSSFYQPASDASVPLDQDRACSVDVAATTCEKVVKGFVKYTKASETAAEKKKNIPRPHEGVEDAKSFSKEPQMKLQNEQFSQEGSPLREKGSAVKINREAISAYLTSPKSERNDSVGASRESDASSGLEPAECKASSGKRPAKRSLVQSRLGETSEKRRKHGDGWIRVMRAENLNCVYHARFYSPREASELLRECEDSLDYLKGDLAMIKIYGRSIPIPRKQVAFGDDGLTYTYSGITVPAKPWTPVLEQVRSKIEEATNYRFNFVLINRYKDGYDSIGEHRDDERDLDERHPIASLSLGQTRDFRLRHGDARKKVRDIEPIELELEHGSLLMMNYPTNQYWYHSLPRRPHQSGVRINMTFRKILRHPGW